jgi:hypothetical protein
MGNDTTIKRSSSGMYVSISKGSIGIQGSGLEEFHCTLSFVKYAWCSLVLFQPYCTALDNKSSSDEFTHPILASVYIILPASDLKKFKR